MPSSIRPGDVLAGRYLLVDLLAESGNGRFWRAVDRTLERPVAVHVVSAGDEHAGAMAAAARSSAALSDRRILRVLDVDEHEGMSYVVNEWGSGTSLDRLVAAEGPISARRAAWVVSEVADTVATAHEARVAHGRLIPENVLIDTAGQVRVIGCSVDAALLGLPPGRLSSDVVDLAGLLYFLLTGKWAGMSRSAVPSAPHEGGAVLRPRRVKAGIPRLLDALCDQVLNPYSEGPDQPALRSARGICDALRDFVGDPAGIAAAELGRVHSGPGSETRPMPVLPPLMDPPAPPYRPPLGHDDTEDTGDPGADDTTEPDRTDATTDATTPGPEPEPPRTEAPTQAGMPIFDEDSDEVSWFAARAAVPPPPPPFEEPPERPLFAPEPAEGAPVRRSRPAAAPGPGSAGYWPWDTGASNTGSGVLPSLDEEAEDDGVPGRSWLRLAAVVAACSLLLLAIVFAFNLGRGRSPLGELPGESSNPTPSASAAASTAPLEVVAASDLDPHGTPPEENRELVPRAVDGDPATTWRTSTYEQDFGPRGLKTGLGLVLDLGEVHDVSVVDLTLVGEPTGVSLYVTDQAPRGVAALQPVTRLEAAERERITLDEPVTGRYVLVWLTSLPTVAGGFRGEVAEIVVRG